MRDKIRLAELERKSSEEQLRSDAKAEASRILSAADNNPDAVAAHPYLVRKKVKAYGELRITKAGLLAVPLRDTAGALHTLQLISDEDRFSGRNKTFLTGGLVSGCYCWIGDTDKEDGPLVICEGYATGATIHEATGFATICAMFSGNLLPVARSLRAAHPDRVLVFAADNDRNTKGNPGVSKAGEAAKAVRGFVSIPEFPSKDKDGTDFNDLAASLGLSAVEGAIHRAFANCADWTVLVEDASDAVAQEIPDPTQLIPGLLTEFSKCVIGGGSKTYKTWLSMNLALGLSARMQFLGRTCLPRRVLYVNLELRPSTFNRRLQIICSRSGAVIHPGMFSSLHLRGRLAGLSVCQIVDRILATAESCEAGVVLLDPIYKLNVEGDENSSRDQTLLFNQLDRLTTEAGCTLVLNDHFSKGNQSEKDPLDAIRGSSAKGGDVDAAIILRAHETKGSYRVDVVHRELPPVEPFVVTWNFPMFETDDTLDAEDMKRAKGGKPSSFDYAQAMTALCKHGKPVNITEWAELAGVPRKTLSDHAQEMRSSGWITTVGEGTSARQEPTEKGRTLYGTDQAKQETNAN